MIIFAPAYDPPTKANLIIAKLIATPTCIALFETNATRQEFIAALSQANLPLFAMSHGERDALKAQNGEIAVSNHDIHLLGKRNVYAFACHTAAQLGKSAAEAGSIWWGYSDIISCAMDSPSVDSIFAEIFTFIRDNFHTAISSHQRQSILAKLKKMCEEAEYQIDLIDEETEIEEIMEVYRTLRHIWDRLRIWIPDAQDPERHPDSSGPFFPWPWPDLLEERWKIGDESGMVASLTKSVIAKTRRLPGALIAYLVALWLRSR